MKSKKSLLILVVLVLLALCAAACDNLPFNSPTVSPSVEPSVEPTVSPSVTPSEPPVEEPDWSLIFTYNGGTITGLTEYGKTLEEIVIPSEIDGTEITAIGNRVFYDCTSLASITIPDSVTSIGYGAF